MRILVPLDESEQSTKALEYALETFPDAEFTVLHVGPGVESRPVTPDQIEQWQEHQREQAEAIFDDARAVAAEYDVDLQSEMAGGKVSQRIVEYADEHAVDAIVMGSHGRDGAARILLGSVAETVVRRAPVPVTIVR